MLLGDIMLPKGGGSVDRKSRHSNPQILGVQAFYPWSTIRYSHIAVIEGVLSR